MPVSGKIEQTVSRKKMTCTHFRRFFSSDASVKSTQFSHACSSSRSVCLQRDILDTLTYPKIWSHTHQHAHIYIYADAHADATISNSMPLSLGTKEVL